PTLHGQYRAFVVCPHCLRSRYSDSSKRSRTLEPFHSCAGPVDELWSFACEDGKNVSSAELQLNHSFDALGCAPELLVSVRSIDCSGTAIELKYSKRKLGSGGSAIVRMAHWMPSANSNVNYAGDSDSPGPKRMHWQDTD